MDPDQSSQMGANHLVGDEGTLQGQTSSALDEGRGSSTADVPASAEVQAVEKQARAQEDPLISLSDKFLNLVLK